MKNELEPTLSKTNSAERRRFSKVRWLAAAGVIGATVAFASDRTIFAPQPTVCKTFTQVGGTRQNCEVVIATESTTFATPDGSSQQVIIDQSGDIFRSSDPPSIPATPTLSDSILSPSIRNFIHGLADLNPIHLPNSQTPPNKSENKSFAITYESYAHLPLTNPLALAAETGPDGNPIIFVGGGRWVTSNNTTQHKPELFMLTNNGKTIMQLALPNRAGAQVGDLSHLPKIQGNISEYLVLFTPDISQNSSDYGYDLGIADTSGRFVPLKRKGIPEDLVFNKILSITESGQNNIEAAIQGTTSNTQALTAQTEIFLINPQTYKIIDQEISN